jgi:hypothetical protein
MVSKTKPVTAFCKCIITFHKNFFIYIKLSQFSFLLFAGTLSVSEIYKLDKHKILKNTLALLLFPVQLCVLHPTLEYNNS